MIAVAFGCHVWAESHTAMSRSILQKQALVQPLFFFVVPGHCCKQLHSTLQHGAAMHLSLTANPVSLTGWAS